MNRTIRETDQERLRNQIIETLNPEDKKTIGEMKKIPGVVGDEIWIVIGGEFCFFGISLESALFTAKQGDWWEPSSAGSMIADDKQWFETRATLGSEWKSRETKSQALERRCRIAVNNRHTTGEVRNTSVPESDTPPAHRFKPWVYSAATDDLLAVRIMELNNRAGVWIFDEISLLMRRVKVRLASGYLIIEFLDAFSADDANSAEGRNIAEITCTDSQELIGLTVYKKGLPISFSAEAILAGEWKFE